MACIGHRDRYGTGRQHVAGKQAPQGLRFETGPQVQIGRKGVIELDEAWVSHRRRGNLSKEAFRQAGVAAGIHALTVASLAEPSRDTLPRVASHEPSRMSAKAMKPPTPRCSSSTNT